MQRYRLRVKFNPNHVPAGSSEGGQFTTAEGLSEGHLPGVKEVTDRYGIKASIDPNSSLSRWIIRRPDGSLGIDPQREALHQKIINDMLKGAQPSDHPTLYMTGGGPAAGKSTAIGSMLPTSDVVRVDPDAIKAQLPEWDIMRAAGDRNVGSFTHEESSLIRKELEREAIAGHYNVILDTTGDSSVTGLTKNLGMYRDAGYKIKGYYATVHPDIAVARAETRGRESGRFVPETVLREAHSNVAYTFPKAVEKGLYDEYRLYNTEEHTPRLVVSGTRGSPMTVHNQQLYNNFTNLAKEHTVKSMDDDRRVPTDVLTDIIVAICSGQPRTSLNLNRAGDIVWNKIADEIEKCPEGWYVDPGNELDKEDLTNLYSGSSRSKYATTAGALDKSIQWVPIKKTDEDRQIVYGEVYAPYVLDTYGEFMTPEDIETMAHRFLKLDLSKVIDTQHDNVPNGSVPVESFIARDGDPDYTPGSWVLGVHIPDPDLWQAVKCGLLNGFSFQSLVKPTDVDVEIDAIRDFVGDTELSEDHNHTFFVELDDIGNVVGGRTSKAPDGHYHEIKWASVTGRTNGHSHRFFL